MATDNQELITLTADIVAAHVSNNSVPTAEVGTLIQSVFSALQGIGTPQPEPQPRSARRGIAERMAALAKIDALDTREKLRRFT